MITASPQAPDRAIEPGFAEPVGTTQAVFRAVLEAMANPGQVVAPPDAIAPVPPLAAVALTLCDLDTPVWLDDSVAARWAGYLKFHCGCPLVAAPEAAAFALVDGFSRLPPLSRFFAGEPAFPDTAATVVVDVDGPAAGPDVSVRLSGPGVPPEAPRTLTLGPAAFWQQVQANGAAFPLGVDLLLVGRGGWVGLPRSVAVEIA